MKVYLISVHQSGHNNMHLIFGVSNFQFITFKSCTKSIFQEALMHTRNEETFNEILIATKKEAKIKLDKIKEDMIDPYHIIWDYFDYLCFDEAHVKIIEWDTKKLDMRFELVKIKEKEKVLAKEINKLKSLEKKIIDI